MKNVHPIDRFVRLLLAVLLLEGAFFWVGGALQWVGYALAAIMVGTSGLAYCPIYQVLGISGTRSAKPLGMGVKVMAMVLLLAAVVGGSYGSVFFTRKLFLEDFNAMNHFYKQTLFLTGKTEREKAVANYDQLLPSFQKFQAKYAAYQPFALRGDAQLQADLANVDQMLKGVNDLVRTGDLHQAHLDLEKVRPVFQEIFKRNGFSMLAVALVDFHDAMELVLDAANAKDADKVIALYPQVSEKLQAIEVEAKDEEIQAIRKNLDAVLAGAKDGKKDALPAQAEQLKSSFVKVYLKRG